MDDILTRLKCFSAFFGVVLGWLFGDENYILCVLIAFVIIDYITGVLLAIYEKKLSSDIGYKGISKKAMIFLLVAVGNLLDKYIIGSGSSIRTMLIMFYIANEGISISENAGKMGLPLPQKLKDILAQLHSKDDK